MFPIPPMLAPTPRAVSMPAIFEAIDLIGPADGTTIAGLRVKRDGTIQFKEGSGNPYVAYPGSTDQWIDAAHQAATVGDQFEVFVNITDQAGGLSGTVGSWVTINADQTWEMQRSTIGSEYAIGTITVREIANPSNSASGAFNIDIEKEDE